VPANWAIQANDRSRAAMIEGHIVVENGAPIAAAGADAPVPWCRTSTNVSIRQQTSTCSRPPRRRRARSGARKRTGDREMDAPCPKSREQPRAIARRRPHGPMTTYLEQYKKRLLRGSDARP